MQRHFLLALLALLPSLLWCQLQLPSAYEIARAPAWAREMYAAHPRLQVVDQLHEVWVMEGHYVRSRHTQYYRHWRPLAEQCLDSAGRVDLSLMEKRRAAAEARLAARPSQKSAGAPDWTLLGPQQVHGEDASIIARQANVFCLGRCEAVPSVLYCGTQGTSVFKSTNGGDSWFPVADGLALASVSAVAVHPTDPDIAYFGAEGSIYRTLDGGAAWAKIFESPSFFPNEIMLNPANPSIVMAAGQGGLWRSTDGGFAWFKIASGKCWDVKVNATDRSRVYLLMSNATEERTEFHMSMDSGATFFPTLTGWYSSTDPARSDQGGRLAVTPADPNRIYAYLIGESKAGDAGFIGVWRSDNGGYTWSLPNPPAGGPYTPAHQNLAVDYPGSTNEQGFYNIGLMASPTDEDEVLLGSLNLYRSTDGGTTWVFQSGYGGTGPIELHVDNQDFRVHADGEAWICTDGGIYRSTDFFHTQPEVKMTGLSGQAFWGFGQGWNQDVVAGGTFHNGDVAHHEAYAPGAFLWLGGSEFATGYVNPQNARKVYFSDDGGSVLPLSIGDPVEEFPFFISPNEFQNPASSSEVEWHPHCHNWAYTGVDHRLMFTRDVGGYLWEEVHAFGSDPLAQLAAIEISRSNPKVMYVVQRPAFGTNGVIHHTTDGGTTWSALVQPAVGSSARILIALSPEHENHLWVAYPDGSNGSKVFRTTDAGATWINLTTAELDGEVIVSMALIGGTHGGLYLFSDYRALYRSTPMTEWQEAGDGLPARIRSNLAKPFYRDGKIRLATYGKGIWEAPLAEAPTRPVACIMVDHFSVFCTQDTFHFDDHSMLNHAGASWQWEFEDGVPSVSSMRDPMVVFNSEGSHQAILTVTDAAGVSDKDTLEVEVTGYPSASLSQGFELVPFPPEDWETTEVPSTPPLRWMWGSVGGFGASSKCAVVDNYTFPGTAHTADLRAPVRFESISKATLTFDVAYTPWNPGPSNSDTLEVLISTDCGWSFTSVYRRGGMDLSTTGMAYALGPFVPTPGQWRTESVNLDAFAGMDNVLITFRDHARYGQLLYLDNIQLTASYVGTADPQRDGQALILAPNPVSSQGELILHGTPQGEVALKVFDAKGRLVAGRQGLRVGDRLRMEAFGLRPGVYGYLLDAGEVMATGKMLVE